MSTAIRSRPHKSAGLTDQSYARQDSQQLSMLLLQAAGSFCQRAAAVKAAGKNIMGSGSSHLYDDLLARIGSSRTPS